MFSARRLKDKIDDWQSPPLNPILVIVFLAGFSVAVALYLAANYKKSAISELITGKLPAIGAIMGGDLSTENELSQMVPFASLDDFKNYLDGGRQAYESGLFEEMLADAQQADFDLPTLENENGDQAISQAAAKKYFSLAPVEKQSAADVIQLAGQKIYFSPQNQYYLPKSVKNRNLTGVTMIFDGADLQKAAQIGTIPQDGNFLIAQNILAVFLDAGLAVYDVSDPASPKELWRGRIEDGSEIVASEHYNSKLYLVVKTDIDPANPCPIKPFEIKGNPFVVDCRQIFHPEKNIFSDAVFTVLEINPLQGEVVNHLSFVGQNRESLALISQGNIYAAWRQDREEISFFNDFLQSKCKSLLPNYLLEKTAKLPAAEISLAGKEFELRRLFSSWLSTVSEKEKERVASEMISRLQEYLRDNSGAFEQTVISKIDMEKFGFGRQALIKGYLPDRQFISLSAGNLRLLALSGRMAARKMAWFITGQTNFGDSLKNPAGAYFLDADLNVEAEASNMDLSHQVCGARFTEKKAYLMGCSLDDPISAVDFDPASLGLRGNFSSALPAYIYPIGDELLLAISKNGKTIKITLFDAVLPAKIKKLAEYDLNDYWIDFEAAYQSFTADNANSRFFLPVSRGGYIFSYAAADLALEEILQSVDASRAGFFGDNLYLAGERGIEFFSAPDWKKIKSIKF